MALSMSVSAGAHNAKHNTDLDYRAGLENVDPSLSADNVTLADEDIADAYDRLFGAATAAYNDRQRAKHPERCIKDYRAKVMDAWKADQAKVRSGAKGRANVPQPCYEYVIQIGNHDTWESVPREKLTEIYTETFERIKTKTRGAIDWFQAAVHYDEPDGSGHMHVAGIAYGTGNKRGLETQVSMNQALKTLGLERLPDLQNLLMKELEQVASEHGIERDVMDCDRKHQDVAAWKQTQRDVADMTERLERKTEQAQKVEERLECLQQRCEEVEPAAVTIGQSARALWEGRGDGSRERGLEGENRELRERVSHLERQVERAEEGIRELEGGMPELQRDVRRARERYRQLEGRFDQLAAAVERVMERLSRIPDTISTWARAIAEELGYEGRLYNPNSLDEVKRRASAAARAYNQSREWEPPTHGQQIGR